VFQRKIAQSLRQFRNNRTL